MCWLDSSQATLALWALLRPVGFHTIHRSQVPPWWNKKKTNQFLSLGEGSDPYFVVSSDDKLILLNYGWQTHFVLQIHKNIPSISMFFVDQRLKNL